MAMLADQAMSLVLLDLSMPHLSGQEILPKIVEDHPEIPVIIFTGVNDIEIAVECMRIGAFDYMVKPVEESRMVSGVKRAIEMRELEQEYTSFKSRVLSDALEMPEAFSHIVTNNSLMRSVFQYTETIAATSRPVLITGETGVGKDLMARALHTLSRKKGEYVAVNIAGLDDNIFADTLFGHQSGAFTDARESRPGLIAKASGGTFFLDEIGDLSPTSQVKLLRLLQEGEYFPLGSDVPKKTDARMILATNRDLKAMQEAGQFRKDLYYRLRTHQINIPPLRERLDDLPVLIDHFLEQASTELGKRKPTPPKELFALLATYHFPGNVRELESIVFDAVSHHESRMLSMNRFKDHIHENRSLPRAVNGVAEPGASPFALFEELPTLKEAQSLIIQEAMRRANGNQTLAAQLLGITQPGLSKALKREKQ
jgi:DNA-binding NtrC family response regulator